MRERERERERERCGRYEREREGGGKNLKREEGILDLNLKRKTNRKFKT